MHATTFVHKTYDNVKREKTSNPIWLAKFTKDKLPIRNLKYI